MNAFRSLIRWIVRAAVFFVLLAFALNNQQEATLHLMFGREWRAPMALIALAAFALGLVVGVLGMLPGRWRQRAKTPSAQTTPAAPVQKTAGHPASNPVMTDSTLEAREF